MFKKINIVIGAMLLSLVLTVSGANAVTVTSTYSDVFSYTVNDGENPGEKGTALDGLAQHAYEFTADGRSNLAFILDWSNDFNAGNFGIQNFTATWSVAGIIGETIHSISNGVSEDIGGSPFFHSLLDGQVGTLVLTGDWRENGGQYALTVSAVPLPPAVIAFGTAMLGVGFLARRRRKQKATFA